MYLFYFDNTAIGMFLHDPNTNNVTRPFNATFHISFLLM